MEILWSLSPFRPGLHSLAIVTWTLVRISARLDLKPYPVHILPYKHIYTILKHPHSGRFVARDQDHLHLLVPRLSHVERMHFAHAFFILNQICFRFTNVRNSTTWDRNYKVRPQSSLFQWDTPPPPPLPI